MGQARSVLDAYGQACVSMRPADGEMQWQTPLARALLLKYGGQDHPQLVARLHAWLQTALTQPTPSAPLERALKTKVGSSLPEHIRRIKRMLGGYFVRDVPARSAAR